MAEIAPGIADEPLLYFEILGEPMPQGSKTAAFNPVTGKRWFRESNPHNLNYWRSDIAKQCRAEMERVGMVGSKDSPALLGALQIGVIFHFARPAAHFSQRKGCETELKPSAPTHKTSRPDCEKLSRSVGDALRHAGLYNEDSHIVRWQPHEKIWSNRDGVEIWVWNLEPTKVARPRVLHIVEDE